MKLKDPSWTWNKWITRVLNLFVPTFAIYAAAWFMAQDMAWWTYSLLLAGVTTTSLLITARYVATRRRSMQKLAKTQVPPSASTSGPSS